LGLGIGVGSALSISGGLFSDANITSGRWSTDPTVGAAAANPWVRATIARVGLLALTKEETVYFNRDVDDDGAKLVEGCTYALSGEAIPTRWWSITIYGADQMLPVNTDGASSIDATRALVAPATTWTGTLSATRPATPGPWLSSKGGGTYSLTIRLYNPQSVEKSALQALKLPSVKKVSCTQTPATGGAN
jgi:hypothetical protein